MKKWEYFTISKERTWMAVEELNKLGLLGWELVAATGGGGHDSVTFILKREIQ